MNEKYVVFFIVGFGFSIVAASLGGASVAAFALSLVVAFAFLVISRKVRLLVAALFFFGASLGFARFYFTTVPRNVSADVLATMHVFTGTVIEEPSRKDDKTQMVVAFDLPRTRVWITTSRYPEFQYGDKVSLAGSLEVPENSSDFDWVSYLDMRGIGYEMYKPKVTLVSHGNGNWVMEKLLVVKRAFLGGLAKVVPEPHASFGGGIALGAKSGVPADLTAEFQVTGTSHLIAVSGYNLTAVVAATEGLLGFVPFALAQWGSLIAIILFTFATGASGATVRAAIMAGAMIAARVLGRPLALFRALMIAAFFMVLQNPRILFFDLSFELSFLAMLGIIFLSPIFEESLSKKIPWTTVRGLIIGTLAPQLAVLPLLLSISGIFSVMALPVNILVLPLVPAAMGLVTITGSLGAVSSYLAFIPGFFTYGILAYILGIIRIAAQMPFASFSFKISSYTMVVAYLVFTVLVWFWYERKKRFQLSFQRVTFEIVD
jgi:competence protein ComEC